MRLEMSAIELKLRIVKPYFIDNAFFGLTDCRRSTLRHRVTLSIGLLLDYMHMTRKVDFCEIEPDGPLKIVWRALVSDLVTISSEC